MDRLRRLSGRIRLMFRRPASMGSRLLVGIVLGLGFAAVAAECRPKAPLPQVGGRDADERADCRLRPGDRTVLSGPQLRRTRPSQDSPDGVVFDASTASWSGFDHTGAMIDWTITLRGDYRHGCWFGGALRGAWNDQAPGMSWEDPFHHAGGFSIKVDNFLLQGISIVNHGDGIISNGRNGRIHGVYLADIHDDCVQNDLLQNLGIHDSLFDGCYVGFSARPTKGDDRDGSDNAWTISDSLIRLEPQPTVYKPERYASPGHGGFFKLDRNGGSPRLSITDSIFRADQDANHGTLGIPPEATLEHCSNNTIVWLGKGEFPDRDELPACFTVTTDVEVWNRAVDDWRIRHPHVTF